MTGGPSVTLTTLLLTFSYPGTSALRRLDVDDAGAVEAQAVGLAASLTEQGLPRDVRDEGLAQLPAMRDEGVGVDDERVRGGDLQRDHRPVRQDRELSLPGDGRGEQTLARCRAAQAGEGDVGPQARPDREQRLGLDREGVARQLDELDLHRVLGE